HPAVGGDDQGSPEMPGAKCGTLPSGACSAARSASHETSGAFTSYKNEAEGAKSCASPVHPKRSARWGQSVGSPPKFPRRDHTAFSCNRFTRELEHSNHPIRSKSVCRTTARTLAGSKLPGHPSIRAYRKPWNVKRGSHVSIPAPFSTYTSSARAPRRGL